MSLELLVLGPQRSGTSMMARCLHNGGFDMGSPYLPITESQPEGFYESYSFSHFLKHGVIHRNRNMDRARQGLEYEADDEDIARLTSFLKFYGGRGYKHTYALALWDLFRRVIDAKCVVITLSRKKSDCVNSSKKSILRRNGMAAWKKMKLNIMSMYDRLADSTRYIENAWSNVIPVRFMDLVTADGQACIQEQFTKYFPGEPLDFSSIKPAIRESGGSNVYETDKPKIIMPEKGIIRVRAELK